MRIAPINNQKQQEFGMLEFQYVRNGKLKYTEQLEEVIDFLREKKVNLILDECDFGKRIFVSTPEKETLLHSVLEFFGAKPRFVRKIPDIGVVRGIAPNVKLSEIVLSDIQSNPLEALKKHFDTVG